MSMRGRSRRVVAGGAVHAFSCSRSRSGAPRFGLIVAFAGVVAAASPATCRCRWPVWRTPPPQASPCSPRDTSTAAVSPKARMILGRIAGILLTAIAVSLIANGGTRMVVATLDALGR